MSWDPGVYLRYESYRTRPAADLLAQVRHDAPCTVYDLGCGPGNSTAILAARFPDAALTGVDSSPEMLGAAAHKGPPGAAWHLADLAGWDPPPADIFFSNATLQWVPGPRLVLERLMAALRPGGVLAFQVPDNFDQRSHTLIPVALGRAGLGARGLWNDDLRYTLPAEEYYSVLAPLAASVDIWDTDYLYVLDGEDPVFHWTSGTALRPLFATLDARDKDKFVADYTALLRQAYPARPDGRTLFPFRRRFAVAVKA